MTVIDVGPDSVRSDGAGPAAEPALVEAALGWIDDPVGLYLDRPVAVGELWRAVMVAAAGESCRRIVVVHPDDWPRLRVERLLAAANTVADEVVATPRSQWAPGEVPDHAVTPRADRSRRQGRSVVLILAPLAAAAVAVLVGGAVAGLRSAPARQAASPSRTEASAEPRTVEEGRVAVRVPADWTVDRVTSGPGSRRLQATSPADPAVAVHITQNYAPEATLTEAAQVLARAIAGQADGVFVDLRADGRFGRPAVTYREIRSGRTVDWWVVVAGATRISVGCQSPTGADETVRAACEQAVVSARERGTDPAR